MSDVVVQFVKQWRRQEGLTHKELARRRAGVKKSFISDLERGKASLRMDKVDQVLDPFGHELGSIKSEPLVLTWDHVDFERKQIQIPSTHTKIGRHRIISFKKDQQLETLLKSLPKRKSGYNRRTKTCLIAIIGFQSTFLAKLLKIGFDWATCHTFRHTYISHQVMAGVPISMVKELSITTTLSYAHLAQAHKSELQFKRPY